MAFQKSSKMKLVLLVIFQISTVIGGVAATVLNSSVLMGIVTFFFAVISVLLLINTRQIKKDSQDAIVNMNKNIDNSGQSGPSFIELENYIDTSIKNKVQIIPVLTGQLQAVISQTDEAAGGLIQAFMGISKHAKKQLSEVQELFGNLSQQTTSDNILFQTQENLKEIQANFSTVTSFFDKSITMITDVVSQLSKVDAVASKIENIQKTTNILALNASIQAAHTGEAGSGFKVIAAEINELSKNSNSSIKEISDITENLTSKVNEIKKELESVYAESRNIGQRTDVLFNQTTCKISSKLEDTAEKIKGIANDAESLSKEISKVVVSIQFQDITRQQIEHVISPLETLKNDFNTSIEKLKKNELDLKTDENVTDALMEQYTMESEREILKKIKSHG